MKRGPACSGAVGCRCDGRNGLPWKMPCPSHSRRSNKKKEKERMSTGSRDTTNHRMENYAHTCTCAYIGQYCKSHACLIVDEVMASSLAYCYTRNVSFYHKIMPQCLVFPHSNNIGNEITTQYPDNGSHLFFFFFFFLGGGVCFVVYTTAQLTSKCVHSPSTS